MQDESIKQKFCKKSGAVFLYSSEKTQLDFDENLSQVHKEPNALVENLLWGKLVTETHGDVDKSYIFIISEISAKFRSRYQSILVLNNQLVVIPNTDGKLYYEY